MCDDEVNGGDKTCVRVFACKADGELNKK